MTKKRTIILFFSIVVLAGVVYFFFRSPPGIEPLAVSQPASSYEEATRRIDLLRQTEPAYMNPLCRTIFLSHGKKTANALLLVHGYTSCPYAWKAFGELMFAKGYNVLIPPFPHHGLADRMTLAHAQLVAEELARFSVQAMDIAHGLGDRITMAGLSAGGVTTAYAAQTRSDVHRAVIIAPAFGYEVVPTPLTQAACNLFRVLPNRFSWWDPKLETAGSPSHAYPRYSTHALAELLRLGSIVHQAARANAPAARSIVVVNNASDHAVNNALTRKIANTWSAHGAAVQIHEFDGSQQLGHDLIDPFRSDQKVDVVYPRLMEWMMN